MDYKIYLVPTPIGNLEDMTLRSLKILKEVDVIACEDTRESRKLLDYFEIKKPLISYHKFNEVERSQEIIQKAKEGASFAIITDQGMPGISDPGQTLVKKCQEEGVSYTILPGPSSIITALIGSAFENSEFAYYGFIPKKTAEKKTYYDKLKKEEKTSIILDTPHNIEATLRDFKDLFPQRRLCIARELTKKFEEYKISKIEDIEIDRLTLKGEFVLILEGDSQEKEVDLEDYREEILGLLNEGRRTKEVTKILVEKTGLPKNQVYDYVISLKED